MEFPLLFPKILVAVLLGAFEVFCPPELFPKMFPPLLFVTEIPVFAELVLNMSAVLLAAYVRTLALLLVILPDLLLLSLFPKMFRF